MNRDDIIRMAREVGIEFKEISEEFRSPFCDGIHIDEFERVVALVYAEGHKDGLDDFEAGVLPAAIKAEREACAQIAHDTYEGFGPHAKGVDFVKQHIAIRIRERGAP